MARDATLALLGVAHHRWWWPCGESVTRDPPHVEDLPANVVDQDLRGAGNLAMAKTVADNSQSTRGRRGRWGSTTGSRYHAGPA